METMIHDIFSFNPFQQEEKQHSFFPIKNNKLKEFWDISTASFWRVSEIDFSKDKQQFDTLDEGTKNCLIDILSFFAQVDGLVLENIEDNFREDFGDIPGINPVYTIQETIETIHNETYSVMIDLLITDPEQKRKCFNAIKEHETVKEIGNLLFKWMSRNAEKLERVLAFIFVEGLLFQSAFTFIYYMKAKNMLPGLTQSNELIARDENLHTQFGIYLYLLLTSTYKLERLTKERVYEILDEFMKVGETWIRYALNPERCKIDKESSMSITSENFIQYMQLIADNLLSFLNYEKRYNVSNPFDFMILQQLSQNTNFFESKVTNYQRTNDKKDNSNLYIV